MIGSMLATYRLVEKLGEGGMGEVYRALDEMLDREVALKMLRPELASRPATVDRFRAEAITLARLDHPGIARIHGCSRHDDRWFIVMEYVAGDTLLARLRRVGRLAWTDAVPIVCQLLDALEYAHRRGVIHRDLKPANVLLGLDGRLKVTDFGIARVLGTERATRTGHIVGTLEYMSPEQVRGEEVDGRADLYAVGIVLHELLTGDVPFSGAAEYDVMMKHLQAPIPSIRRAAPDAPAWFDGILQRALAKSAAERFASAAEFQVALETCAAGEPALRMKPTRLAVDPIEAPTVVPSLASPATIPSAVAETRLAAGPGPTRLAAPPALTAAGPAAGPATGHAAAPVARLAQQLAARGITWRQLVAAGSALAAMLIVGVVLVARAWSGGGEIAVDAGADPPAPPPATRHQAPVEAPLDAPPPEPGLPPATLGPIRPPTGRVPVAPVSPAGPVAPPVRTAPPPADAREIERPAPAEAETAAEPPGRAPVEEAASASANVVEIEEVMLVTAAGGDELEVLLRFEGDRLVLFDPDSETTVRALPYRSLSEVTYARTRNPVGRAERDRSTFVKGLARAGSIFRRTPHWLTIEGAGAPVVLKPDGGDVERILGLLENRANLKVERVSDK
jgi:serine/threonine-protein kinase